MRVERPATRMLAHHVSHHQEEAITTYVVIGFGAVGQALARAFARKGIDVLVAGRRPPAVLMPVAGSIGPAVRPATVAEAAAADGIILAAPFRAASRGRRGGGLEE